MAAPIGLREEFDALALRGLAKKTRDANQSRRLLAIAEIYDGGSRGDAARIGGVGLQTIRDWVLRFNARGPDGLMMARRQGGCPSSTSLNARRWPASSRADRSRPFTGWCAGG